MKYIKTKRENQNKPSKIGEKKHNRRTCKMNIGGNLLPLSVKVLEISRPMSLSVSLIVIIRQHKR